MDLQPIISTFAIVGAIGQLFFLFNLFYSIFYGQRRCRILEVEHP